MFGWFKRVRRSDPVFGSMLFMGDKMRYWEGKAQFAPTGTAIEVMVDGASDDSMSRQHEFFQTVCSLWCDLLPVLVARIRQEHAHSADESLQLSALSIPESQFSNDAEWEVSFSTLGESNYTVHLKGRKPESVDWDT